MSQPQSSQIEVIQQSRQESVVHSIFKSAYWENRNPQGTKKRSPHYPCKRWGHSAVVSGKHMYVFGGFGKSENVKQCSFQQYEKPKQWKQIFRLDCMTYTWDCLVSPSAEHPSKRDSHTCVKLGNKLYIFGGSVNEVIVNELWSFDLSTYVWREIRVDPALNAREGHSAVALDHRLMYIYGGWHSELNEIYNEHWIFDSDTSQMVKIDNFSGDEILKRESHSAVLMGDSVYIFGGQGQNVGKSQLFYRDLYQIRFPALKTIHQIFDNKYESVYLIFLHIEKIKVNGQLPSARASHSAVAYLDRFMFILAGEGNKCDTPRDNDDPIAMENEEPEDEENKPVYPKNDVWVFETHLRMWTKLQLKSKVFQARCSNSCVVFKDQIIVFGGLISTNEQLEDLVTLQLNDKDNHLKVFKKEEMKNICKYCQLIYGFNQHKQEDHTTKQVMNIPKQKISLSYVESIVKLIKWPFASFGLLIDNATYSGSKRIKINMIDRDRIQIYQQELDTTYNINQKIRTIEVMEEEIDTITEQNFLDMFFHYESSPMVLNNSLMNGPQAKNLIQEEQRKYEKRKYGNNIKNACLRLGQSFLVITKIKKVFFVGFMSTNIQMNPNLQDLIIFHYSVKIEENNRIYTDNWQKNIVLNQINHIINEDEIIKPANFDYTRIIIFDLIKLPIQPSQPTYELQTQKNDIINNNYQAFLNISSEFKGNKLWESLPDYSLRQYIKMYQIDNNKNLQITLQDQVIISGCSQLFNGMDQFTQCLTICPNLKEIYENMSIYHTTSILQGVYIYSRGRLIQRIPCELGDHNLEKDSINLVGFIDLKDYFGVNIHYTNLESDFLYKMLKSSLIKVISKAEHSLIEKVPAIQMECVSEINQIKNNDQIENEIKDDIQDQIIDNNINEVKDDNKHDIRQQIFLEMKYDIMNNMKNGNFHYINNTVRDVIRDDTKDVIRNQIRDNFKDDNIRNFIRHNIIDDIRNDINNQNINNQNINSSQEKPKEDNNLNNPQEVQGQDIIQEKQEDPNSLNYYGNPIEISSELMEVQEIFPVNQNRIVEDSANEEELINENILIEAFEDINKAFEECEPPITKVIKLE